MNNMTNMTKDAAFEAIENVIGEREAMALTDADDTCTSRDLAIEFGLDAAWKGGLATAIEVIDALRSAE